MDKIWDRKSFKVGGHWPLWRGGKNRMTTQNRQKSNEKNINKKNIKRVKYSGTEVVWWHSDCEEDLTKHYMFLISLTNFNVPDKNLTIWLGVISFLWRYLYLLTVLFILWNSGGMCCSSHITLLKGPCQ